MIEFRTGDIVFRRTTWWFAKLIHKIAKVKYNHTGVIVMWDGTPMVIEAIETGVHAVAFENWNKGAEMKVSRPKRTIDEKAYRDKALAIAGNTPYDYIGVTFRQAWYNITGRYIGKMASKETKSFYCYEFMAYMNSEDHPDWHKALPRDLENADWHFTAFEGVWKEVA